MLVNGAAGESLAVLGIFGKMARPPSDVDGHRASPSIENIRLKLLGTISAIFEVVTSSSTISPPYSE